MNKTARLLSILDRRSGLRKWFPITIAFLLSLGGAQCILQAAEPKKPDDSSGASKKSAPAAAEKAYKDINVEQFDKLRADKKSIIVDVRTPEEFAAGHIAG